MNSPRLEIPMLTINGIDIPIWGYKDTVIRYTYIHEKSREGIELRNQVRDQLQI